MLFAKVIAFALLASLCACGSFAMSFDKEKWASGKDNFEGKNPRIYMVTDAEEAGVKVGATRASIHSLLGEPDSTDSEGDIWTLGHGGYSMDPRHLNIGYDKNNIATEVSVRQT